LPFRPSLKLADKMPCVHEAGLNTRGSFSRPSLSWCLSTSEYFLSDKMPLVPRCWKEHSYFKCFELQMSQIYCVNAPVWFEVGVWWSPSQFAPESQGKVLCTFSPLCDRLMMFYLRSSLSSISLDGPWSCACCKLLVILSICMLQSKDNRFAIWRRCIDRGIFNTFPCSLNGKCNLDCLNHNSAHFLWSQSNAN